MSWIGMTDHDRNLFNPAGIGAPVDNSVNAGHDILTQGTLVAETQFIATAGSNQTVLHYRRDKEWLRELIMELTADGRLRMFFRQGGATFDAEIDFPAPERDTRIRLYYSWNGPERWARLAVKIVETGAFYIKKVRDPLPMPMLDALTIMRNGKATAIASNTVFVAISNEIEPVGLSAGITAGTPVETPSGAVPVERLRLGDHVRTATSGVRPVRWITKRTVPALGAFRPVRLRAPFFGLSQDILVAPDHRIRVDGADAEYMLGTDEVLLEARRLIGSHAALAEPGLKMVTYYHVLLDRHECLLHDSLWSESLYVGQIGGDRDRLNATALAEMPASAVPTHQGFARQRLSDVEARSLAAVLHR
ncbi:Hint domain-containing protein [Maritimibacter dapengensis]|uniref:Hint domain-containing protein n=1 Tax=Maritimibacter dapengensis TaxID=2836868 RepID=A0ABS6T3N7_9RHOB|nr:Hint domain-containing protein [Maritimibacter dapengensis]MBV7379870.1 Hint domain-containing protein [Maritimibacter dapengensis]